MSRLLNLVQKLLNLETNHGDRELERARAGEQAKKKGKTQSQEYINIHIHCTQLAINIDCLVGTHRSCWNSQYDNTAVRQPDNKNQPYAMQTTKNHV